MNTKRYKLSDYPCDGCPPPPIFKPINPVTKPSAKIFDELLDHQKVVVSKVKSVIVSYIGECHVTLFGSQMRGNWTETSDYDFFVFTPTKVSSEARQSILTYDYGVEVNIFFQTRSYDPLAPGIGIEIF